MAFSFPDFPQLLRAQHQGLTPAAQAVPGVHWETVCPVGTDAAGEAGQAPLRGFDSSAKFSNLTTTP